MRIVALVKSPDHVCCRYRLAAYVPYLQALGHSLTLLPLPRQWLSRLFIHNYVGLTDLLIIQRKLLPAWQLHLLKRTTETLAFDFDDAVFCRDSYDPHGVSCPHRLARFRTTLENVDYAITGNQFLREQASLWIPPSKIFQIPTCVNTNRYTLAGHDSSKPHLQMVWIGTWSTLRGLDRVRPMFETIGRLCPQLSLKIICDRFLEFEHLSTIPCPWSGDTEAAELAWADVGISWLPDDLWSQGKCGLKVLQYMAAGLPVIVNPVGLHCQLVQHGVNGFFVESAEEFIHALEMLRQDPSLRGQMGKAGREFVESHFSLKQGTAGWQKLLDQIVRDGVLGPVQTQKPNTILLTDQV